MLQHIAADCEIQHIAADCEIVNLCNDSCSIYRLGLSDESSVIYRLSSRSIKQKVNKNFKVQI